MAGRSEIRVLIAVSMFVCLSSVAQAATGTATYYMPSCVPSTCFGCQNNGVMVAAASSVIWNNRASCGRSYRVTCIGSMYQGARPCTGKNAEVKIVDYCPLGCGGTIDLSKAAFAVIANPRAGKIKIQYSQI